MNFIVYSTGNSIREIVLVYILRRFPGVAGVVV
jgi:hypothetical protein